MGAECMEKYWNTWIDTVLLLSPSVAMAQTPSCTALPAAAPPSRVHIIPSQHKSQPCPVWSQRTILSLFHRTVISGTPWQIWAKQLQGPFAAGSKLTYFLLFFSLQSMTKYGALSSASFRPKSDKERKGMTKIPFLQWIVGITGKSNICTLWAFSK